MRHPVNLACHGIQAYDISGVKYYHSTLAYTRHRRHKSTFLNTEFFEIQVILKGLACMGIMTIEAVFVRFYPYILTRVDIDILGIAGDAALIHP